MAAKQLSYADDARQKLLAGVSKLARAVRSTLGPRGRNAVLDKGWGSPTVTKDGVTVAEEIELNDPYENMGAQLVKEAASKTSDVAGDGTTTATVLAEAIFREGLKAIAAGADPMALDPRHPEGRREGRRGAAQASPRRSTRRTTRRSPRSPPSPANNDTRDRQEAGRGDEEGRRHQRRHHHRRRQDRRDRGRRRPGHAVRPRLPVAALRHQPGVGHLRVREPVHPHLRREDQHRQDADPAARDDLARRRSRCSSSPRTSKARPWRRWC